MNRSMIAKCAKAKKLAMAEVMDNENLRSIADKDKRPKSVDFAIHYKPMALTKYV